MSLENSLDRLAYVTGASSGIGAATAIKFSENQYKVILIGRNKERLTEVSKKCVGPTEIVVCDLNDSAQIDKIPLISAREIVLINNAGIYINKPFHETTLETWKEMFNTNLFGSVCMTQKLWPLLTKNGGSIVNVSSTLGLRTSPNNSAYSASKAAMISWTHTLALEGGASKIRVNCVCPGIVDTPIHGFHSLAESSKQKALDSMAHLQPIGRIGTAEEIAESIYFLGSSKSSWTTGAILSVDGGINLT